MPQAMRFGPTNVISLPSRCAAWSGSCMTERQTEPSSAQTLGTLPNFLPFLTNFVASQLFSRRLLMSASTLLALEVALSSPA